jgi:hypothetical protein
MDKIEKKYGEIMRYILDKGIRLKFLFFSVLALFIISLSLPIS